MKSHLWEGVAKKGFLDVRSGKNLKIIQGLENPLNGFRLHASLWMFLLAVVYCNIKPNCKIQCKVHPESRVFKKLSKVKLF